jgi:glycosyltransferase involved in cell wall biosynthesis
MRILMTMFGWADGGGGTILPRQLAKDLVRRGHEVTVVYAAVPPLPNAGPYAVNEHSDDGVALVGIHNRPTPFLDDRAPARELHDPTTVAIFAAVLRAVRPDVVHYHNFLGLSAGITGPVADSGVPSCSSTHNFWAVCPTLYLQLPGLVVCGGVAADGANCLQCTRSSEPGSAYVARRDRLRETLTHDVDLCLVPSFAVREVFTANGYPADWLRVVRLGNPRAERLWQQVGQARPAGVQRPLRFGFLGSVLPIKGVHLLVGAAQALRGELEVHIHGDGPAEYVDALRRLDARGVVRFHGGYDETTLALRLQAIDVGVVPSTCLDQAPLVIDELQAARVPVLGARIGGIPDHVQADAGRLFAAGDMAALAIVMQQVLDAPARAAAWQQNLLPPPTFARYVDNVLDVYRELQARPRQPKTPSPREAKA